MTCDHCVKAVSDSLYSLDGVTKVDANLKDQLVTVEGTSRLTPVARWLPENPWLRTPANSDLPPVRSRPLGHCERH